MQRHTLKERMFNVYRLYSSIIMVYGATSMLNFFWALMVSAFGAMGCF